MAPLAPQSERRSAYVFVDLETTGVDSERDVITEMAWAWTGAAGMEHVHYLVDYDGFPSVWSARNTAALAENRSSRHKLRFVLYEFFKACLSLSENGATDVFLIGACPAFDDRFLRKVFREVPYNYHVIDVEAMAIGALGLTRPPSLRELRCSLGIAGENEKPQDALYDALEAKLVFEAIFARRSGDPR